MTSGGTSWREEGSCREPGVGVGPGTLAGESVEGLHSPELPRSSPPGESHHPEREKEAEGRGREAGRRAAWLLGERYRQLDHSRLDRSGHDVPEGLLPW